MKIRLTVEFDDAERAQIARFYHREYGDPKRKLATREQCVRFLDFGLNQAKTAADDSDVDAAEETRREA